MTYHTSDTNTDSNTDTNTDSNTDTNSSQTVECLTLNTIVNVINSSGNKYQFNGLTNYDSNKVFGLGIGNYVFQDISINHPMALLNNDVSNLISYSGDSSKKLEKKVGDISYDFYHGDINVSVNSDFSGLSVYCYYHNYMGGENLLKYSDTCHETSTTIQPSNALKCLSQESRVNIVSFNQNLNKYVFNNELAYDPIIRYGLYNGTYVLQNISQSHPMAILNYNISGVLTYSGDLSKKFIKMIDDISYNFYYGDININVYGPFGTTSIACYNHENMRMDNIFSYSIFCNSQAIITTPTEISYEFNDTNIIQKREDSNDETNYFINYNNDLRPWKINTSYISHNNNSYVNESLKQKNDSKYYNFHNDASKNNLIIESADSNIDLNTYNSNSINFQGITNFNNNSYFNKSVTFEESVISKETITTTNLVANEISTNVIRLSDSQTFNFIGDLNIDGNININTGITGDDGEVQVGRILNEYTINNSELKDSSLNNTNINNSLIGITGPSQAIFTDVSINNAVINNDIIINNNLILKNIEENGYIYTTLNSNVLASKYQILNENNTVFFKIPENNLTFELPNIISSDTDNKRGLDNYKFYLEKNNKYYFENLDDTTSSISIGLYFKDFSNINISIQNDTYSYNNKDFYIYDEDTSFNIDILGNFVYADLILLEKISLNYLFKKEFEKVFLYKHDFNLIDKIESVDNSINNLLTSYYDASFSNLIITNDISLNQNLFVGSDVSLNSNLFVQDDVSLNSKLFVQDDVSLNSKLFVENDVSFNSNLFVQDEVSLNNKLFVENDVSFNSKLFVENDVSFNSKLFVQNDVSLNSKLFVQNDVSLNSKLFVQNDLTVEGNATFNNTIKGNAETATALKTTRNIGGVSFDGTANIDLPGVNTTGNQDTSGSSGSCTGNAETATLATKANTLSQGGNNGTAMTFNWVPQTGQPSYLWGGSNNGTDIYVYSPSNFNVKYANTAGRSDSINGYVINQNLREMDNVKFHSVSVKYTGNQWWGANNYYTVIWDFTGSHGNINNFNFNVNIDYNGLIVSCTDQYINKDYSIKPKISESLPLTKLTTIENDKAVFGVIAYQPAANYNINNFKVNSLGEGAIWIVNKNGNLEIGDYISSSTITGYGQKQNDDILHNYTVAKITCNCDFSLVKQIKQKIITISNENYIEAEYKEIGSSEERDLSRFINYDENGNIQYEDDLDLSGNQVYEYKFDTRFLDASSNILSDEEDYLTRLNNGENVYIACFVGCTYHCG